MLIRIKSSEPDQPPVAVEKPTFAELTPRGPNRLFSLLASLGLHVALVWVAVSTVEVVESQMALIQDEEYPIIALQLSAVSYDHPRYLTDPVKAPAARAGNSGRASAPKAAAPGSSPDTSQGGRAPAPRGGKRFQLPVVTKKPAHQILIRADLPPDLELDPKIAVPEVLLWQQALPEKPKGTIITAEHSEEDPVRERQTPNVDPKLTEQNKEQQLAEVRQADAPPVPKPALPTPVANTTPIRLLDGVDGKKLPNSTGPVVPVPEEVHVISIPDRPVPQAHIVVLPPANQGAPRPSPAGSGSGQGAANNGKQSGTAADSQKQGAGAAGDTTAKANPASNQPGSAGAPGASGGAAAGKANSLSASAATGNGVTAAGSAGSGSGKSSDVNGGLGAAPPNTTRIVRPKDGKYTVTVLGSSNLDAYPEAAGILSGKLVYTVYVRAGGRKEWILQYCLPAAAEQAVKLRGSAVPVAAPYPFEIYHPNLKLQNDPEYVIVHGFITATGQFERLSAVGDIDSADKATLVGALEHWQFRPAARDGEPIAVEVALIIPRETS